MADPDAIFKLAAEHSGERVFESAEILFSVIIEDSPPSSEQISARVDLISKIIQEQIARHQDEPFLRRQFEQALEKNREVVTAQMLANARREMKGRFLAKGRQIGGDRYTDYLLRRGTSESWDALSALLTRRIDQVTRRTVYFDGVGRLAVVGPDSVTKGIEELTRLGRLNGFSLFLFRHDSDSPPADPAWLATYNCVEASELTDSSGLTGITIISKATSIKVATIQVDTTRDYLCPLVIDYFPSGEEKCRWTCGEYFLDLTSKLWFPKDCAVRYKPEESSVEDHTLTYKFDSTGCSFNRTISAEAFAVRVPRGSGVVDRLKTPEQSWKATCDLTLKIDDLDSLDKNPCLEKVVVMPVAERSASGLVNARRSWLPFIVVNGVVALLLAFFVIKKMTATKSSPAS